MIWPFRSKRPLGQQGERAAAAHLRRQGFRIIGRNVQLGRYEIDIIARQGDTIAFVEVKTRRDDALLDPQVNVDAEKRRRIIKAAREYAARHEDPNTYYRFDIVAVVLPRHGKPAVTHYPSAFTAD